MKIKNWDRFQHYGKKRNKSAKLPWIKFYSTLLDDPEWFNLSGDASRLLVMCWLLASENDGDLPPIKTMAFRFRMPEQDVNSLLSTLSHWIEGIASNLLADCYQPASRDRDRDRDRDREEITTLVKTAKATAPPKSPQGDDVAFGVFWKAYPRKVNKPLALRSWNKLKPDPPLQDQILKALEQHKKSDQWTRDGGQYIPHPSTWLNGQRWNDELTSNSNRKRPSTIFDRIMGTESRGEFQTEKVGGLPDLS